MFSRIVVYSIAQARNPGTKRVLCISNKKLIPQQYLGNRNFSVSQKAMSGSGSLLTQLAYSQGTGVAAEAAGKTALAFTPWECLLGGMSLGVVSDGKLAINGKILGISGIIKGLLNGNMDLWRILFFVGFGVGSFGVAQFMPTAFDALPATFTNQRAAVAGLLVGLGSAIGNGCTSGHGICGNSRFSVRSMAYTCIFMAAGMASAALFASREALGVAAVSPAYAPIEQSGLTMGLGILGAAIVSTTGLGLLAKRFELGSKVSKFINYGMEFLAGTIFALGLGFSEMTRPSKVISFLDITSSAWNISLAFVMGGALLVATPVSRLVLYSKYKLTRPLAAQKFEVPKRTDIDLPLVTGGVLFGAGWGIGGMCPGPALVNMAQPCSQTLVFVAMMMIGMRLAGPVSQLGKSLMSKTANSATKGNAAM
eukprot:TRINITY_DN2332_c1_g2_i1.p1 TRINITY_DN2332_c1_g2~~TRINITY_DN2332_c1_g2_i1.p1  ORF type:complete len:471 (+),score=45.89 TRINITY_DN2332_c1_g2_i1:142-1413(+)